MIFNSKTEVFSNAEESTSSAGRCVSVPLCVFYIMLLALMFDEYIFVAFQP